MTTTRQRPFVFMRELRWCVLVAAILVRPTLADEAAQREFFEKHIRPVLVRECYECHSAATPTPKGGLRLDSRERLRTGGESGAAVEPGEPEASLLLQALRHEGLAMPPERRLAPDVVARFAEWIADGAYDPRETEADPDAVAAAVWDVQFERRREWWSLQAVARPPVPPVADLQWPRGAIDRFILSRLEAEQLAPAAKADRVTLARRATFVLTGLPPTWDDIESFEADPRPDAWERFVDRLLASPHFGEHWARHWMDVVRYTDTYGYEWDIPAKGAWRYRDYLTRAWNEDVSFLRLVQEQIAGDLLEARVNRREWINESLVGPMFYQMGEKRHGDSAEFNGIHQEMLDNKIDALSKAFQATTVACARCHDHKLDAVAQREYYALAGIFMSSRWVTNTLDLPQRHAAHLAELDALKTKLRASLAERWLRDLASMAAELDASHSQVEATPSPESPAAETSDEARRAAAWRKLLANQGERTWEDPLRTWSAVMQAEPATMADAWTATRQQYAEERARRGADNARDYELITDFSDGLPAGWSADGVGFRSLVRAGDFNVALAGDKIIDRVWPRGLISHTRSTLFNAVLRTPLLDQLPKARLTLECTAGEFCAQRTVVDNAFLTEKQSYLNQQVLGWLEVAVPAGLRGRRTYLEFATKTSNPNFPPRVGLGGACSEEQAADPRSWFGVSRIYAHDKAGPPADELTRFEALFAEEPPADRLEVARRYQRWFEAAVQAWAEDRATRDDVVLINWLLDQGLLSNLAAAPLNAELVALRDRYRELERRLPAPATVNGMADIDGGVDYRLNIRGDYDQLGEPVPRGFLEAVCGAAPHVTGERSGRLELARWIGSDSNPLTARVFVNRVWHWLFGTGLVATVDDFGHLGELPSHPELLDYLASRFVAEGWSLKQLVREIVLTETWQQSGDVTDRARDLDPRNRLWHHYPLRRVEAESLRDAMLAVSGRLDTGLYGPPLNPPRANEDDQKRLFSGPLDGNGRRSIYTKITIMEPPRFLATFNQPAPKIPTGRRDVTNTPAQSLTLLNDPLVAHLAEHWGQSLATSNSSDPRKRIIQMFRKALGREPSAPEQERWLAAADDLARLHGVTAGEMMTSAAVWKDLAHALFNTKEFLYVR